MKYLKYIPLFLGLVASPLRALDEDLYGTQVFLSREKFTMFYIFMGIRGKDNREVYGKWEAVQITGVNQFGHEITDKTPLVEARFTGKIISGDHSKGKIEIKFSGNVPYEEVSKKTGEIWTISPDPENRYYSKIAVPMMRTMSGANFESVQIFTEQETGD